MARSRRRGSGPAFPVALLLLSRQIYVVCGMAFVHPLSGTQLDWRLSSCQVCNQLRMAYGVGLSKPSRSAAQARRSRALPISVSRAGLSPVGVAVVVEDGAPVHHSGEQEAWLGRIQYYGGREMWRKAEDKFWQMQDEGVPPTLAICNSLMEAYLKGRRHVNAVDFLEGMCLGNVFVEKEQNENAAGEQSAIVPDLRTFNLVLATLASAGKWEKALQVSAPLRTIPRSSRSSGGRSRRGGAVSDALKAAAAELQADGETYTHLIVACGKGREPDRSREMFDEMRAAGIAPTPQSTAALIRALAKAGHGPTEALRLLGDMRAAEGGEGRRDSRGGGEVGGAIVDEAEARREGFGGAIEACVAVGEWQKAVSLLDEMRRAKVAPDSRCYGDAMRACAEAGNWQLALALLNTMKKEGVPRTAFNYNIAMQACRKADRGRKAMSLLAEMKEDGVLPDIVTYNTCVTVAGQAGRLDETLELLRKASEEEGLQLDVVSYRAAMGALRREKRWEAAIKLLDDMRRRRGVEPDEVSVAMAMNACVAAQQPLRAVDLFHDMRDVDKVFPRIASVTALLKALSDLGRWKDALQELRALSASGVKPDGRAIAHAMEACNSAKKWEETLGLHRYCEKMDIESSMEGLVLVARAHGALGECQGVLDVLAAAERACSSSGEREAGLGDTDLTRRGGRGNGKGDAPLHPPSELYEAAARSLAMNDKWEEAASAIRSLENLPPVRAGKNISKNDNQQHQRGRTAAPSTYELILGAAAAAADAGSNDEAVLAQADAARAALALRNSASRNVIVDDDATASSTNDVIGGDRQRHPPQRRWRGELSTGALAHEAGAAGRLGRWDRVSRMIAAALAKTPTRGDGGEGSMLRGFAGARLYASLISAAVACGKPERGLEIYREMAEEENSDDDAEYEFEGNSDGEGTPLMLWPHSGNRLRLPPPDWATFMAALDAIQALDGDHGPESVVGLAIGVAKQAAALAREKPPTSACAGENENRFRSENEIESEGISGSGSRSDPPTQTVCSPKSASVLTRKLALVLSRAAEVCAPWEPTTAEALRIKAAELEGKDAATGGVGAGSNGA